MKRGTYIGQYELEDFLMVGVMATHARQIAKRTTESDWKRKLNTVATYLEGILRQRLEPMKALAFDDKGNISDKGAYKALQSIRRRTDHSEINFTSTDVMRCSSNEEVPKITIDYKDLIGLFAVTDQFCCKSCVTTGDDIKNCPVRELLHKLDCPIYDDTPESSCEYHYVEGVELKDKL